MEQLNIQFPEAPKTPQFSQEQLVENARKIYGIYNRPFTEGEDGNWYTTDFDGTAIEASEWNKKMDDLDIPEKNGRKYFN